MYTNNHILVFIHIVTLIFSLEIWTFNIFRFLHFWWEIVYGCVLWILMRQHLCFILDSCIFKPFQKKKRKKYCLLVKWYAWQKTDTNLDEKRIWLLDLYRRKHVCVLKIHSRSTMLYDELIKMWKRNSNRTNWRIVDWNATYMMWWWWWWCSIIILCVCLLFYFVRLFKFLLLYRSSVWFG